jgi:hypothetical protein
VILQAPPFDTLANKEDNSDDIFVIRGFKNEDFFLKEKHSGIVLGEGVPTITNLIPMGVEAGMPLTPAVGSLHDELHGLLLNHFTTTALTDLTIGFR